MSRWKCKRKAYCPYKLDWTEEEGFIECGAQLDSCKYAEYDK